MTEGIAHAPRRSLLLQEASCALEAGPSAAEHALLAEERQKLAFGALPHPVLVVKVMRRQGNATIVTWALRHLKARHLGIIGRPG